MNLGKPNSNVYSDKDTIFKAIICRYMHDKRNTTVKYLGMYVNEKIWWISQIGYISITLIKLIYAFWRMPECKDYGTIRQIYYRYVHLHNLYGSELCGCTNKTLLKRIQNQFLYAPSGKTSPYSTWQIHLEFNLLNAENIHKFHCLFFYISKQTIVCLTYLMTILN